MSILKQSINQKCNEYFSSNFKITAPESFIQQASEHRTISKESLRLKNARRFSQTATAATRLPKARVDDNFRQVAQQQIAKAGIGIKFDLDHKKSVITDELGIDLNQPKLTYHEYIDHAYEAIDTFAANNFEDIELLKKAVSNFLAAISLDKKSYEAYFGLGYTYSLVQDFKNSLYFLDIAYQLSGRDQLIGTFFEKVKSNMVSV